MIQESAYGNRQSHSKTDENESQATQETR